MTEPKWETYRDYSFRLVKDGGEWWVYLRYPSGRPVLWNSLFENGREYGFSSFFRKRAIHKARRWIDNEWDARTTVKKRWP